MSNKLMNITALLAMALGCTAAPVLAEDVDQHPKKVGTIEEFRPIADFCGTNPIKVAYSSGFSSDPWRQISRREFELEAAKCPNITETRYTDAQGSVEKQISDITGLAAQGFDVIIIYPDGGESLLRAMSQAVNDHGIGTLFFRAKGTPAFGVERHAGKRPIRRSWSGLHS